MWKYCERMRIYRSFYIFKNPFLSSLLTSLQLWEEALRPALSHPFASCHLLSSVDPNTGAPSLPSAGTMHPLSKQTLSLFCVFFNSLLKFVNIVSVISNLLKRNIFLIYILVFFRSTSNNNHFLSHDKSITKKNIKNMEKLD